MLCHSRQWFNLHLYNRSMPTVRDNKVKLENITAYSRVLEVRRKRLGTLSRNSHKFANRKECCFVFNISTIVVAYRGAGLQTRKSKLLEFFI